MMPAPAQLACLACGYDLSGIEAGRCPECGAERVDTGGLSPRAARWVNNPWRWLGIPLALHAGVVIAWWLLFGMAIEPGPVMSPAPWAWPNWEELLTGVVIVTVAFLVLFLPTIGAHAMCWSLTTDSTEDNRLRGLVWWFTLPALYSACIAGPAIVIAEHALTGSHRTADINFAVFLALLSPWLWRAGWAVGASVSGISLRPCARHWIAACFLGGAAAFLSHWFLGSVRMWVQI